MLIENSFFDRLQNRTNLQKFMRRNGGIKDWIMYKFS